MPYVPQMAVSAREELLLGGDGVSILRECPEHGETLRAEVDLLVCEYFHMTMPSGKRKCLYTEPLPAQQQMQQAGAPMMEGMEDSE